MKQPQPFPSPSLLNRHQAAKALGVSTRMLDHWIAAGKIHPTRLGRLVRLHPDEVARLCREGIS